MMSPCKVLTTTMALCLFLEEIFYEKRCVSFLVRFCCNTGRSMLVMELFDFFISTELKAVKP